MTESICIIAGSGSLPAVAARSAEADGKIIHVIFAGLDKPDPGLDRFNPLYIPLIQFGKIIGAMKKAGISTAALVGKIDKRMLYDTKSMDDRTLSGLRRMKSMTDEALLMAMVEECENEGIHFPPQTELLPGLVTRHMAYTSNNLTADERKDLKLARDTAQITAAMGIGQAVAVCRGVILAVEAIEGTDAMIERVGKMNIRGAVIVKMMRSGQDPRVDVPTAGPGTIMAMIKAQCRVLYLQAKRTFILEPDTCMNMASKSGIDIIAGE